MEVWIDCGVNFIRADVIRWKEAVFDGPFARNGQRARRGKRICVGEIEVVAEVLAEADAKGFARLLVRASSIVAARDDVPVKPQPLKIGREVGRQTKTLLRNGVQRLAWSDETARAAIVKG